MIIFYQAKKTPKGFKITRSDYSENLNDYIKEIFIKYEPNKESAKAYLKGIENNFLKSLKPYKTEWIKGLSLILRIEELSHEITIEELKENISDLIESIKQINFYLDNGATNGEYINTRQELIINFDGLIKDLNNYVNQEELKEMNKIENQLKNLKEKKQ